MKKFLPSILLAGAIGLLAACSNGDYSVNPDNAANSSINPLNPLKAEDFTWSGQDPVSADINGSHWVADAATFALDTSGTNIIIATKGVNTMVFYLKNVWSGNLYDMGFHQYVTSATYIDSLTAPNGPYISYYGNSGEVKINQNDTDVIKGQFYFQGATTNGKIVSVTNGYFNVTKP